MIVSTISEKVDKSDADSLESVTIKDEPGLTLPSSRAYSVTSEPPAYQKRTSSSVKIARLIAVTVVAVALILGAAIIAAAYIQSMNNSKTATTTAATSNSAALSTETNVSAASAKSLVQDTPTADQLTGDEEHHINKVDQPDETSAEDDDTKDHNRMDTEPDLLEEFLENEGKILRLPTGLGDDFDFDIDELTKMFMARNPLDKSKCFVERKPIEGDLIRTLPITSKNASAVPLFPVVSGERISIICSSSDEDDSDADADSGIIPARPIMMPILGMRPPSPNSIAALLGPMGPSPFQLNGLSRFNNGPVPSMMMPPPSFRSASRPMPPPFGLSPPWMNNVNNDLAAEQRSMNAFLNAPPPFLRPNNFQQQQQQQPQRAIRFPTDQSAGQQFQQFQQFPSPPFQQHQQQRNPVMADHSQEKSFVPEQQPTFGRFPQPAPVQQQQPQRPIFRIPQPNPPVPDLPESLIRLLEDLPDLDQPAKPSGSFRPARVENGAQPVPIIRVAFAPQPQQPQPQPQPASTTVASPKAPSPFAARPANLPFLNVPIRPPMPLPEADRREGPTFFERLIQSLLGVGDEEHKNISRPNAKMSDSMPMESRIPTMVPPAIRTGSRAMREPLDVPSGMIIARPVDMEDQQPVVVSVAPAVGEDRVARSHLIQPRSVEAN